MKTLESSDKTATKCKSSLKSTNDYVLKHRNMYVTKSKLASLSIYSDHHAFSMSIIFNLMRFSTSEYSISSLYLHDPLTYNFQSKLSGIFLKI